MSGLGQAAEAVHDPYLVAFLSAKKKSVAAEKGVELELGERAGRPPGRRPGRGHDRGGNLIDNAIDAARLGAARPARVEVDLLAVGTTLHVSVVDTGSLASRGVAGRDLQRRRLVRGSQRNGLGLALCRQAARSLGRDVRLADTDERCGALFVAVLPNVLETGGLSSQETKS